MFSNKEQEILLKLLLCKQTGSDFKVRSSFEYKTINLLIENEYVEIIKKHPLTVGLTPIGDSLASLIAKHTKTDQNYRKYAGVVFLVTVR